MISKKPIITNALKTTAIIFRNFKDDAKACFISDRGHYFPVGEKHSSYNPKLLAFATLAINTLLVLSRNQKLWCQVEHKKRKVKWSSSSTNIADYQAVYGIFNV